MKQPSFLPADRRTPTPTRNLGGNPRPGRGLLGLSLLSLLTGFAACDDAPKRGILGTTCAQDGECETDFCGGGVCLLPEADEDGDGLTNTVEKEIGSNPRSADSDYDGIDDGAELDSGRGLLDIDGDGIPDILESATDDPDGDCLPNQFDPDNDAPNSDLTGLVPVLCRTVGVCADTTNLAVQCEDGVQSATCVYDAVPDFEAEETSCDGLDNDCDGIVDDGFMDSDKDGTADCVDGDLDGDDTDNGDDNCPNVRNADQADADGDGAGDACDPPVAPVLLTLTPGTHGSVAEIGLAGVREPGTAVFIHGGTECAGEPLAAVAAGVDGAFTATANADEGLNRFSLVAENAAGLRSGCAPSGLTYTLDSTAPPAPVASGFTVTPPSPAFTDSPRISGAIEAEGRICFYSDDSCSMLLDCATADGTGAVDTRVPLPGPGTYAVHAVVSDLAGNGSACTPLFDYQVIPGVLSRPIAPSPYAPGAFVEGSPNGTTVSPTVRVCGPANAPVDVYTEAGCVGEGTALTAGASDPSCPGGVLHSGSVALSANAVTQLFAMVTTDDGWNSTCVFVGSFEHDDRAPPPLQAITFRPASPSSDRTPVLTATGTEPFALVSLHLNPACTNPGQTPFIANASGALTALVEVPANTTSTVYAILQDRVGNRTTCTQLDTYRHDDLPPAAPSLTASWPRPTSNATIPLRGCAEPGASMAFSFSPTCASAVVTTTVAAAGAPCTGGLGAFDTTASAPPNAETEVFVRLSDTAGNRTDCLRLGSYLHDDTPPARPTLDEEEILAYTAEAVTMRVTGTGEAGATARLLRIAPGTALSQTAPCTGTQFGLGTVAADGTFSFDVDVPRDMPHSLTVAIRDAASNVSTCAVARDVLGLATIEVDPEHPPLEAPALLFHTPDGGLLTWDYDPDVFVTSLSALVFKGCTGTAAWMPERLGYSDRRRLDTIEVRPGETWALPSPIVEPCYECNFQYGDSAFLSLSVPGAPAGSTIAVYDGNFNTTFIAGPEPGTVYLSPDPRQRYQCLDGTPENCTAWNFRKYLYALVRDESGAIIGYAHHGWFVYAPGDQLNLSMAYRTNQIRYAIDVHNGLSVGVNAVIQPQMQSGEIVIDTVHRDGTDYYGGSDDFPVSAGGDVAATQVFLPAVANRWLAQVGWFGATSGSVFSASFQFRRRNGNPPASIPFDLADSMALIAVTALDPGSETRRASVQYAIAPEDVAAADLFMNVGRLRIDWYDVNLGNQESLREWVVLKRPRANASLHLLEFPELFTAWDPYETDIDVPEGAWVNDELPISLLMDVDFASGFDDLTETLGVRELFALFGEDRGTEDVFGRFPDEFALRAVQVVVNRDGRATDGPN